MENFNFFNPTEIIFGKDRENEVGDAVLKYGKKVLLHYGGGSIKKSGLYDRVIRSWCVGALNCAKRKTSTLFLRSAAAA